MVEEPGLGRRMAKGAAWVILQRLAVRAIGLVSTIILARLIVPADFGLVALATTVLAAVETLSEFGFDLALIQKQTRERRDYDTAWTLTAARGALVALVLIAAAQPMAKFFGDPRLVGVVAFIAAASFISGLQNVGVVEFRKELRFDREFRLLVWSKLGAFVVTVTLAWVWRDYRALVAGIVAGSTFGLCLSYLVHPYRPRFTLSGVRGFVHFSKWLAVNNLIVIVRGRLDTFVVGKAAGLDSLGHYNVAYEISNLATSELIWPISRAAFPGFAKIQTRPEELARRFLDVLSFIFLLAAPIAVGVGLTAEHIVRLFLGPRWLSSVPLIEVLTIYGLLNLPSANSAALYYALGRPDLLCLRNLPAVLVLVPALVYGVVAYGAVGAAWALVLSALVSLIVNFALLHRQLRFALGDAVEAIWRPVLAAALMAAAVGALERLWPTERELLALLVQLAALALAGAAIYVGAVAGLWRLAGRPGGAEHHAVHAWQSWVGSPGSGAAPRE